MAHSLASGCGGRVRDPKNSACEIFLHYSILYNNVVYGLQLVRLFVNFVPTINCLTLINLFLWQKVRFFGAQLAERSVM